MNRTIYINENYKLLKASNNVVEGGLARNIAIITDEISKLVVNSANKKEFDGKNQVKAKNIKTNVLPILSSEWLR